MYADWYMALNSISQKGLWTHNTILQIMDSLSPENYEQISDNVAHVMTSVAPFTNMV